MNSSLPTVLNIEQTKSYLDNNFVIVHEWKCVCQMRGCSICHNQGRGVTLRKGNDLCFGVLETLECNGFADYYMDNTQGGLIIHAATSKDRIKLSFPVTAIPKLLAAIARSFDGEYSRLDNVPCELRIL